MPGATHDDYARKLDELDRLLNDPDVPMRPALIWCLVEEVSAQGRRDGQQIPVGDGPNTGPRLHVVGYAWE